MGSMKEISIQVKVCPECDRAYYPSLYHKGIIFVHNKLMITIDLILDLTILMQTGGGFIEAIKKKLQLLGQAEGLNREDIKPDLNSMSLKLEKLTIAVMALMLKDSDMDDVVCYICGNCPKIVREAIIIMLITVYI